MDDISGSRTTNAAGAATRTVGAAVAGAILLLFGTPLRILWVDAAGGWWIVYLLWLLAIGLLGFFSWRER